MKPRLRALGMAACMVASLLSGTVLGEADCDEPVAHWKSRDTLRHQLESKGWTVKRIRVDDGCYEVHGIDENGNRVEAKYDPASLEILELETRYRRKHRHAGHVE